MATLKKLTRGIRSESLRGAFMVDTVRGVLRIRKWPRKRGTPKSAKQLWWIDWFKQANYLAKYVDGAAAARAIEITAGSGKYPRDIIVSAMRGRLYSWIDQNGKKWHSMAAVQDISDSLDVLAQTVGDILVRATDRWRAPAAGAAGQVLTHQGAGAAPEWASAAGGGGFQGGCLAYMSAGQSILNATPTKLLWDTEVYDTAGIHSIVSNTGDFVIPAGTTWARAIVQGRWPGAFNCSLWCEVNGVKVAGVGYVQSTTMVNGLAASAVFPVVATDIVSLWARNDSGATRVFSATLGNGHGFVELL